MASNNPYAILEDNGQKPTWLLHFMILHTIYITNLLELWSMMDLLGHPHVDGHMVHNSTQPMVFPYLTILTFQQQTPKRLNLIHTKNDTPNCYIQCSRCCLLQINMIFRFKSAKFESISTSMNGCIL